MNNDSWLNKIILRKIFIILLMSIILLFSFFMSYKNIKNYWNLRNKNFNNKKIEELNHKKKSAYKEPIRLSDKKDFDRLLESINQLSKSLSTLEVISLTGKHKRLGSYSKQEVDMEMLTTYKQLLLFLHGLEKNYPGIYWQEIKLSLVSYPEISTKIVFSILNK